MKIEKDDLSEITFSYVVDEESDVSEGGKLVAVCRIIAQNDFIQLSLNEISDGEIILSSEDLRGLAEKLNQWADISDETLK